jgi:hypothetical protein
MIVVVQRQRSGTCAGQQGMVDASLDEWTDGRGQRIFLADGLPDRCHSDVGRPLTVITDAYRRAVERGVAPD